LRSRNHYRLLPSQRQNLQSLLLPSFLSSPCSLSKLTSIASIATPVFPTLTCRIKRRVFSTRPSCHPPRCQFVHHCVVVPHLRSRFLGMQISGLALHALASPIHSFLRLGNKRLGAHRHILRRRTTLEGGRIVISLIIRLRSPSIIHQEVLIVWTTWVLKRYMDEGCFRENPHGCLQSIHLGGELPFRHVHVRWTNCH